MFNSLPDLKLNIIGFGPQEEVLKKMASFNISFLGAISNDKIFHYYQSNDVFLFCLLNQSHGDWLLRRL
nr:hypothetical protein [Bacteroides sp. PHL 2737]